MTSAHPTSTRAIITHPPKDNAPDWQLQNVYIRDPNAHEVLVRIVASGVCHTDLVFSMTPVESGLVYPKVLGHEGGGIVSKVGSSVTHVKEGDLVLLSFDYCSQPDCYNCAAETVGYCHTFNQLNIVCDSSVYKTEGKDGGQGEEVAGLFFGQSSFAEYALVKENSVVNVTGLVNGEEELKMFVPFGCGFQTGAATVTEAAKLGEKDTIAIVGLGGVGMLAVMVRFSVSRLIS
jgi:Zn-dependent alcohol dehydrogenase